MSDGTKNDMLGRRQFILATLCQSLFVTALPGAAGGAQHDTVRDLLNAGLPNVETARRIGLRILEQQPDFAGQAQRHLHELKIMSADLGRKLDRSLSDFRRRLRDQIDLDLRSDDVVIVDGWIMARTEAAFCAAVARFSSGDL